MISPNHLLNRYLCLMLLLMAAGCKTKHIDSEPAFKVSFIKNDIWEIKKFCFGEIQGSNGKFLKKTCIDTLDYVMEFPFNINEKSALFIFKQTNQRDTLEVGYDIEIGKGADEFKPFVKNFHILHTTFNSVTIQPKLTGRPDEAESIVIHF